MILPIITTINLFGQILGRKKGVRWAVVSAVALNAPQQSLHSRPKPKKFPSHFITVSAQN